MAAPLPGSVDRKTVRPEYAEDAGAAAPLPGSVDRKNKGHEMFDYALDGPLPSRGAWIEKCFASYITYMPARPLPSRGAWIENLSVAPGFCV